MAIQKIIKYLLPILGCISSTYALDGTAPQVNDEVRTVIAMLSIKYTVNSPTSSLYQQPFILHCGGTVINNRYLITALHCLDKTDFDASSTTNSAYTLTLSKIDIMLPYQRHYGSNASQNFSNGCFATGMQSMFDYTDSEICSGNVREGLQQCPYDSKGNSYNLGFKPSNSAIYRVKGVQAIYVHKRQGNRFFPDIAVLDLGPDAIPTKEQSATNIQIPPVNGQSPLIKQNGADVYGFSSGYDSKTNISTQGDLHSFKVTSNSVSINPNVDPGKLSIKDINLSPGDSGSPALTKVSGNGSTKYYLTGIAVTSNDTLHTGSLTNIAYYSDWILNIFNKTIDQSDTISCHQGVPCSLN